MKTGDIAIVGLNVFAMIVASISFVSAVASGSVALMILYVALFGGNLYAAIHIHQTSPRS